MTLQASARKRYALAASSYCLLKKYLLATVRTYKGATQVTLACQWFGVGS